MNPLSVQGISVRFGGLLALNDVSLDAAAGDVTGLIGPNGAGKTTLFNVVTGLQRPTSGRVVLGGNDVTWLAPHRRARAGLGRTFQRLEVFGSLSVRENVEVSAGRGVGSRAIDDLLALVGLSEVAETRASTLPTGSARLVELARALATKPKVLLCDECSSGLTDDETAGVAEVLRRVAADGVAVLLVEHDMPFVMTLCDRIHVLNFGQHIAEGTPAEIQADPAVRAAYLGDTSRQAVIVARTTDATSLGSERSPTSADRAIPVLELAGIRAGYGGIEVLHGIDLQVHRGEVFALLGPNGAGKSTTLKVMNGEVAPMSGTVSICGRTVTGVRADALARAGVCTIPEGRGVFPNLTVDDNLRMSLFCGASFDVARERAFAQFPRLGERRHQLAGTMSGGEQQMLSIARALVVDPAVLIIDELSMGLAPLVVRQLYETVAELAAEGSMAIVIVEQFAHDVLGIAARAAVMLNGRVSGVGPTAEIAELVESGSLGALASSPGG